MDKYFFIFDLDGTLTKKETLPQIAKHFGLKKEIKKLTKKAIKGEVPYIENFIKRINILKHLDINKVDKVLGEIKLFKKIVKFINENPTNCAIATTNIDVWIKTLTKGVKAPIYTSKAEIQNNKIKKLTYILKKEEIVKKYQKKGYKVVFIGDGHNDLEAMRIADVSIASGLIHYPASSLLSIVDYLVFDEKKLVYFLNQIKNPNDDISVVLSAAGIGSRLGLNKTKVLLKFKNGTLLKRHIQNFKDINDLRIVVGYQANDVIKEALKYTKDILFVYNHDYFYTKTGYSYYLGAKFANEYVIEWDGDLVINKDDIKKLLVKKEYIAGSEIQSEEPVFLQVKENKVYGFSYENGEYEWSGPCCLKKEKIKLNKGNVFEIIEPYLPIDFVKVDGMDIDTYEDYKKAKKYE
jgi:HAD superfamily phosphoserine phosphatase-like hydrolase